MRLRALSLVSLVGCAHPPLADPMPPRQPPLTLAVDLHMHVSMSQAAKPIFIGEPGTGLSTLGSQRLVNQIDEAGMHASGLRLALAAVWPPFELRPGRTSLDETVNQLQELIEFGRRRPAFAVVYSAAAARRALARGRLALLPQIEGGEGITEVDDIDRLWNVGARVMTLVHFGNSHLGGAAKDQMLKNLFNIRTAAHEPLGLTPLGKAAVERMIALGMVIDLSHASDALSNDVLAIVEPRGVPVINSHSGARVLKDMERSIPDALAVRIAKGGGLIGITIFDKMVNEVPDSARWPGFVPNTCDEVVAHWLQLAKAVGPEALTLGTDFNGFITRHGPGGSCPNGLRHVGDLPDLFAALEAHGVPRAALDGMGEKFLALVEVVESKADPAARIRARRVHSVDTNLFDAP